MNPKLGEEVVVEGEGELFRNIAELTRRQMQRGPNDEGLRVQHAKATACVEARFEILADVPPGLRYGLFSRTGRTFDAWVRFSNPPGKIEEDKKDSGRGLAIKVFGVEGARAMDGDAEPVQDFVMLDHPVFIFPNAEEYLDFLRDKDKSEALAKLKMVLFNFQQAKIVKAMRDNPMTNPLYLQYWSGSPYWLGSDDRSTGHAVKYSVCPAAGMNADGGELKEGKGSPLRQAMRDTLGRSEVVFDFQIQVQTDPVNMPVEDATVEWSEQVSRPVTVARLRIPAQVVSPDGQGEERYERARFNPWHALACHRPLGGLNRLRKEAYQASADARSAAS